MKAESALRSRGFLARIDDRLNPIVVKELRQAVQSRFVVTALMALLCLQLVAIAIYLLASGSVLMGFDAGRQVFMLLFGILLAVGVIFVPFYSAIRLVSERSDTNIDLLFITTIKPRSIIAGKLFAGTVLTVLIFSACLPFMAFTYFLRGVDLPSILIVLVLGFLVVMACTQAAIFIAAMPINRIFKAAFGLISLWLFTMVYFGAMAGSSELLSSGAGSRLGSAEFWQGAGTFLLITGLLIALLYFLSVALITPAAANRALPVRLFITSAWLFSGVAALIWSVVSKSFTPLIAWVLVFNLIFALAIFVAVSERDRLGRRVLKAIPVSLLKRRLAFIFYSGSAGGLAWACLSIGLTIAVVWLWVKLFPAYRDHDDLSRTSRWVGSLALYFFCYALSAAWLRRFLLRRVSGELTWLIGVILMLIGSIVPFLIGVLFFFGDQWWSADFGNWLVGNPFAWTTKAGRFYLGAAGVWAVLVAALNLGWFIERVTAFRPLEERQRERGTHGKDSKQING